MNIDLVIAFYPGAGGNRYYKFISNEEFQTPGKLYDTEVTDQHFSARYLISEPMVNTSVVLTHCMNQRMIRSVLGNSVDIVMIDFPLNLCLRRYWGLHGRDRYRKYYDQTKFDFSNKLIHYNNYKDPTWPEIHTEDQYLNLPVEIAQELAESFEQSSLASDIEIQQQGAHETVKWHHNYYKQFPLDSQNCQIVNSDSNSEFVSVMKQELAMYQDEIFDKSWQDFYT